MKVKHVLKSTKIFAKIRVDVRFFKNGVDGTKNFGLLPQFNEGV